LLGSVLLRLGDIPHLVKYLESRGHYIVRIVYLVSEIEEVLAGDLDFSVAIINDPLPSGEKGEAAANLIREKHPSAKIIAVSDERQDWADFTLMRFPSDREVRQAIEEV